MWCADSWEQNSRCLVQMLPGAVGGKGRKNKTIKTDTKKLLKHSLTFIKFQETPDWPATTILVCDGAEAGYSGGLDVDELTLEWSALA